MSNKRQIREIVGVVVGDKMNKTRVIEVKRAQNAGLYQKRTVGYTRLYVHDEKNESKMGDKVKALAARPLSKLKHFRLVAVLERGAEG